MSFISNFCIDSEAGIFPEPSNTFQASTKTSPEYMLDFASAYVTANSAYVLTELENSGELHSDELISLFTPNAGSADYKVNQLKNTPAGMHGFILTETATTSDTVKIKICFRGMQPFSDPSSFQRGLELGGPGLNSFIESSHKIMKQIEAITKQYASVDLEFTGHSLGGADASYAFHDFLYHYTHDAQFRNVDKVMLNSLNAPGSYIELKDSLSHLLFLNKIDPTPLKIDINIAVSDCDIVSQFGESPFSDIPADWATVQVCHVDKIGYNPYSSWGDFFNILPEIIKEMVYLAHTLEPIFSTKSISEQELSPNFSYDYYNNLTDKGIEQINEILEYKWHITSAINQFAKGLNDLSGLAKIAQTHFDACMEGEFNEEYTDNYSDLYADLNAGNNIDACLTLSNLSECYYQESQQLDLLSVQEPVCCFG